MKEANRHLRVAKTQGADSHIDMLASLMLLSHA